MPITREEQITTEETTPQAETPTPAPVTRPVPAPGRPASFEEAKARVFKKYDRALRELAK